MLALYSLFENNSCILRLKVELFLYIKNVSYFGRRKSEGEIYLPYCTVIKVYTIHLTMYVLCTLCTLIHLTMYVLCTLCTLNTLY